MAFPLCLRDLREVYIKRYGFLWGFTRFLLNWPRYKCRILLSVLSPFIIVVCKKWTDNSRAFACAPDSVTKINNCLYYMPNWNKVLLTYLLTCKLAIIGPRPVVVFCFVFFKLSVLFTDDFFLEWASCVSWSFISL